MTAASTVHRLNTLVSAIVSRAKLASQAGKTFDGKRDLYEQLGYKRSISFSDYQERYDRGDIASRVVDAYPLATWRNAPKVTANTRHPSFDRAWERLLERLPIFHYLERLDRISGIGQYGVLMVGVRGGRPLDQPINSVNGPDGVIYLSVYSEGNAEISKLDSDASSPRFGRPEQYSISLGSTVVSGEIQLLTKPVHFTRVLHVAENLNEDEIFGTPRMRRVWNRLDDLDKVVGGASEAVWKTVDRGIQFDIDKDLELDPDDEADFADEIEEYMHGMKRYLRTRGITANVLGSTVPDPKGPFDVLVSMISAGTGIPQRILTGSERGQLASSQDERNFHSRVKERQINYAQSKILLPFVERMVSIGALPEPRGGLKVEWPDLTVLTAKDMADVAARISQAIDKVSSQTKKGQTMVITPREFRRLYLKDLPEEVPASNPDINTPDTGGPSATSSNG